MATKPKQPGESGKVEEWINIDELPLPNAIIKTLHTDGKEDVCRVVNGVIYAIDTHTDEPITHYKIITLQ